MKSGVAISWQNQPGRMAVPDVPWHKPDINPALEGLENTVICPHHALATADMTGAMTQSGVDKQAAAFQGKPNLTLVN